MNYPSFPCKLLAPCVAVFGVLFASSACAQVPKQLPKGIALQRDWDKAMSDGMATMNELRDLISGFASPAANTTATPDLEIYKGVKYLMPIQEALLLLGVKQKVNSKNMVGCPGFPYLSLFSYCFNGNFEGGFDAVYIVTDLAQKVVAVEFTCVAPGKTNVSPDQTKKEWVTFDFVNTRIKGQPKAKVAHDTQKTSPNVLCIDSIFLNPDGKEMHPTRLFLPLPLAELILYRISKTGQR